MLDSGLFQIYTSRADYARYRGADKLTDYIAFGTHRVVIISLWMAQSIETDGFTQQLKALLERKTKLHVDIALLSPASAALPQLARHLDMTVDDARHRIEQSLMALHQMREHLAPSAKPRMGLRVYDSLPAFTTIIIDPDEDDCRVQIDLKPYRQPRHNSFAIEFKGCGKYMVELLRNAGSACFEDAHPYNPAP